MPLDQTKSAEANQAVALSAIADRTDTLGLASLSTGNRAKWRREFNVVNSTFWDVTTATPGITIPDPVGGVIVVPMGTTANAESWMVSKQAFSFPLKIAVGLQLAQKIANNEVYVELVGANADGTLDETRVAAWRIAGSDTVTVTSAATQVRNGQAARRQSPLVTTVSQTAAVAIMEITAESDEVWFSSKPADSVAARTVATVMNQVAPDPEGMYKVRIRFKNGATAPASSTNVTLQFALAIDYTEQQVEVTGGNGNSQPGQAIPVSIPAGSSVSGSLIALQASATAAGAGVTKVLTAASVNATLVKATGARVYGWQFANLHATEMRYVHLVNKATAPVPGTDAAASTILTIPVPPGGRPVEHAASVPLAFGLGLGYSVTMGPGDQDATVLSAAGDVVGHLEWI